MRITLSLVLFCSLYTALRAQQAAYFVLGEKELKGLHVYDVIQDTLANYLISTNEGIYYYDFHHFKKLPCFQAKGTAVFNFVCDSKGTIFCCNLNHQIFRIQDGHCSLIYELQPDEISPDLSLAIGPEDELLASAKKIIVFNDRLIPHAKFSHRNTHWGLPFQTQSRELLYHFPGTDSLLSARADGFHWLRLSLSPAKTSSLSLLSFFRIGRQSYAVDLDSKNLYAFDEQHFTLRPLPSPPALARSKSLRVYPLTGMTWLAGTLPGTYCLRHQSALQAPALLYEHLFISDVFQDHEGNILLSTFDNGILVIPDLDIPDVIHPFQDDPVTALYHDPATRILYLGTSKGQLLSYRQGQLSTLSTNGMRAILGIYSHPDFPYLLYDDGQIHAYHKLTANTHALTQAVLKDVLITDSHTAYLATNMGLWHCQWDAQGKYICDRLPQFTSRVHLLARQPSSSQLIASTSQGLFVISSQGQSRRLQWHHADIFPTAMVTWGDTLILTTQKDGVLLLHKGLLLKQLWFHQPLPEHFSKLAIASQTLLAKSSHALYQFSHDGTLLKNISKVHGLPTRIFDFILQDSLLWISHARGVQAINLSYQQKSPQPPSLRLTHLFVNDQWTHPAHSPIFQSQQRKFHFHLSSPTLRHKETTKIRYRLQGYDQDWHSHPNTATPIVYNALAPGTYTLLAQAENQGRQSSILTYHFEIASPYYARWWFILAVALALLVLVSFIFRYLLQRQRKKAQLLNELNASKLMAIQSQMNPHFIFNALNSIQDLVLKGDIQNSYSYLNVFANLVRSTLSHSDKNFIDFDQELKLLQLYLSLEQLRFKKEFHYTIQAQGIEDIQVPPLLIQPFVENALLHGLLHKEGPKRLHIQFELRDQLICTIEDNGIGRQQAQAIKERQQSAHESFSGKAIRTRFDILSDIFQGQFGYGYEDLEENGQITGTRVTLRIPVKRTF